MVSLSLKCTAAEFRLAVFAMHDTDSYNIPSAVVVDTRNRSAFVFACTMCNMCIVAVGSMCMGTLQAVYVVFVVRPTH